jgi:hypothetical protein
VCAPELCGSAPMTFLQINACLAGDLRVGLSAAPTNSGIRPQGEQTNTVGALRYRVQSQAAKAVWLVREPVQV